MKMYDEEKTRELLEEIGGVTDDGISIMDGKNIPELLQRSVVSVKVTTGKGQFKTGISASQLGVDIKSKSNETKTFLSEYVEAGTINFFSKTLERKISNIQTRIRTQISRVAIQGISGDYVTKNNYKDLKEKFLKAQKDFLEQRDYILENHESLRKGFEKKANAVFKELGSDEKDGLVKSLVSKFPTEGEIKRNFYMEMIVTPYPVLGDMPEVEDLDTEMFKDAVSGNEVDAVATFYEMIGNVLSNLVKRIVNISKTIQDGNPIPFQALLGMENAIKTATNDNDILKNSNIRTYSAIMKKVYVDKLSLVNEGQAIEDSEILSTAEVLLGKIYTYANYLGIEELVAESFKDSGYDAETLLAIGEFSPDLESLL